MNRADRVGGKRKNTVGFALTVLQRRLASSPEAIYKSLLRRSDRLERKKQEILNGTYVEREPSIDLESLDADEYNAEEIEQIEEELLDAATAAQTVEELDAELRELAALTTVAKRVRDSGTDRKWTELSAILQDHALTTDRDGRPRKFLIFTEHRDTLDYLSAKIRSLLGKPDAVQAIHGGVRRGDRRLITEEFTKNRDCQILIATDAAGEGLNLQAAHLMVNYDLPWNPNRIEQRFGRIHRIGQEEVCRLWNVVASNTREGDVFVRLLVKVEEQRKAYGGKVFDVLGEAFAETPLRDLLLEAIRYGICPRSRPRCTRSSTAGCRWGSRSCSKSALWRPSISPRPISLRSAPRWMRPAPAAYSPTTSSWRSRRRSPGSAVASPNANRDATRSPTCQRMSVPASMDRSRPSMTE